MARQLILDQQAKEIIINHVIGNITHLQSNENNSLVIWYLNEPFVVSGVSSLFYEGERTLTGWYEVHRKLALIECISAINLHRFYYSKQKTTTYRLRAQLAMTYDNIVQEFVGQSWKIPAFASEYALLLESYDLVALKISRDLITFYTKTNELSYYHEIVLII